MLEIKNLTKKYGSFTALDGLSLTLDHGVYGILGANGAGKTTFLNLLTDNIKRTSGDILYDGKEILSMGRDFRRKVGYTPQLLGIYEDFSARKFLHYIGALKGMKHKECKLQTEETLQLVALSKYAHKRLGSFSGGMRQRVLLAAALLDNPEILILDEPTSGLDPEERIRLRDHIAAIAKDRTVLLATHVVVDIEIIAQKVILMSHGKLIKFDTPQKLIQDVCTEIGADSLTLEDVYLHYAKSGRTQEDKEEKSDV
jgi:ABC-type multidrug transport system ATPase subunit